MEKTLKDNDIISLKLAKGILIFFMILIFFITYLTVLEIGETIYNPHGNSFLETL